MADVPVTEARVLIAAEAEEERFLPEGPRPVTVEGREALAWVNIQTAAEATQGTIHLRVWDTGECRRYDMPGRPGFLLPTDQPNVVLVGCTKDLGMLDLATGAWSTYVTIPDTDPRTIINDGEIVPGGGAIVFGTKDVQFAEPIAHLYLLTLSDRRVSILADGPTCSNGKVFARTADGLVLFDIDTPRRVVTRCSFDLAARSIRPLGVAIDLQATEGFPDGMVDAGAGEVIIAFYNPFRGGDGRAARYDVHSGELVEEWITPGAPRVTCPLLLRRNGAVMLVLTTAVEGMPAEQRRASPHSGDLFIADTNLHDVPATEVVRLGHS